MANSERREERRGGGNHSIVGKGNHSANHVQKLKPRVEQVCRELGVRYETEENAGRIYVDLQGGEAAPPPERPPQHHDHHHGGDGDGHHHHRPRPPHHRPHEEEDLLTKAVRKLADCCVIM